MKLKILTLISFCSILIVNFGCAPSLQLIKRNFYSYDLLSSELKNIKSDYKGFVDLEIIGNTYEGKDISCLKVGHPVTDNKPALMAIFAEHSGEHETTSLAMKFVIFLINNYGKEHKITTILNEKESISYQ